MLATHTFTSLENSSAMFKWETLSQTTTSKMNSNKRKLEIFSEDSVPISLDGADMRTPLPNRVSEKQEEESTTAELDRPTEILSVPSPQEGVRLSMEVLTLELLVELCWGKLNVNHASKRPKVADQKMLLNSVIFTQQPIQVIKGNLLYPFPILKVPHFAGLENLTPVLELHRCKFDAKQWQPCEFYPDAVKFTQQPTPTVHNISGTCYFVFDSIKFDFKSNNPKDRMYKLKISYVGAVWWSDAFAIICKPKERLPEHVASSAEITATENSKKNIVIGNVSLKSILYGETKELVIHGNFPSYPNYIVRVGNQDFTPKLKPTNHSLVVDIHFDEECKQKELDVTVLVKHTAVEVTKSKCITLHCGWNTRRMLWIGKMKNSENSSCPFGALPRDMIKEIQKYL